LHDRYCYLNGSYILCPALDARDDETFDCRIFCGELGPALKNTLSGLLGERRPVNTPSRAEKCKKDGIFISLLVGRTGTTQDLEEPEEVEE
jgi:hypothetical protein